MYLLKKSPPCLNPERERFCGELVYLTPPVSGSLNFPEGFYFYKNHFFAYMTWKMPYKVHQTMLKRRTRAGLAVVDFKTPSPLESPPTSAAKPRTWGGGVLRFSGASEIAGARRPRGFASYGFFDRSCLSRRARWYPPPRLPGYRPPGARVSKYGGIRTRYRRRPVYGQGVQC